MLVELTSQDHANVLNKERQAKRFPSHGGLDAAEDCGTVVCGTVHAPTRVPPPCPLTNHPSNWHAHRIKILRGRFPSLELDAPSILSHVNICS